jgi:hypothetical protein
VVLTPAVDRFTIIDTIWSSPVVQQINTWLGLTGRFAIDSVTSTTRTELLSETERPAEFLRQIQVNFTLEGFDPGETLTEVKFDGIDVTP